MKHAKKLTAIVLGGSILFLMCSCSSEPEKKKDDEITERTETERTERTERSETERTEREEDPEVELIFGGGDIEYTIDPTAETIIDEYGVSQTALQSKNLGTLIGFDDCYCEGYMDVIGHCNWTIYNGDGEEIACQFGYDCEDGPDCYAADIDGDGADELICNCTYGADGAQRVFIFENNDGVIEVGSFDETRMTQELGEELCVVAYNMFYDETSNSILFLYFSGAQYSIPMSDFTFSKYVPGEGL